MQRFAILITLALFIPACDESISEPTDAASEPILVKRTADMAIAQTEEGEVLWSVPSARLVIDDEVEARKLAAMRCFVCPRCDFYDNFFICYDCIEVSCN